ncbi:MAG: hypothetical protein HOO06_12660 [Bdellovibrionaceae bacterium]|nr:hypothetical protein [Pseudobdellovibrionaceae bacterium]
MYYHFAICLLLLLPTQLFAGEQANLGTTEKPELIQEALETLGLPANFLNPANPDLQEITFQNDDKSNQVTLQVETLFGVVITASQNRDGKQFTTSLTRVTSGDKSLFEAHSFDQKEKGSEIRNYRLFTVGQIQAIGKMKRENLPKLQRKLTRLHSKGGFNFENPEKIALKAKNKKRFGLNQLIRYSNDPGANPQLFLFCDNKTYMFNLEVGSSPIRLVGTGIVKTSAANNTSEFKFDGLEKYVTDSNILSCDIAHSYMQVADNSANETLIVSFNKQLTQRQIEMHGALKEILAWKTVLNQVLANLDSQSTEIQPQ